MLPDSFPLRMELIQKLTHKPVPVFRKNTSGFRVHQILQFQKLFIKMGNGCGRIHPFWVMDLSSMAATKGKRPSNADGTDGIQPICILDALTLQGPRSPGIPAKRDRVKAKAEYEKNA